MKKKTEQTITTPVVNKERLCEDCGDPIAPARLKILPNTRLCIECAEDAEAEMKSRQARGEFEYQGGEHDEESLVETLRDLTES